MYKLQLITYSNKYLMSVFVKSIIKKPHKMFWRYAKNLNIEHSHLTFNDENFDENVYQNFQSFSKGILVNDEESQKIYMITPMKSHQYSKQLTVYLNINNQYVNITVKKLLDVMEFDLSIYMCECKNYMKLVKYCYNLKQFDYELKKYEKIYVNSCNLTKNENKFGIQEINYQALIDNIIFDNLTSKLLIKVPVYRLNIENIEDNSILNGSPILDETNKFIGLISDYGKLDGKILGIPSYCIRYVIDSINKNINVSNLNTIMVNTKLIPLENLNELYNCLYVEENYGIKYNRIIPKNTFIHKVNNQTFDKMGLLYSDKLKYSLPLSSYILLHNEITNYTFDMIYNNEKQNTFRINVIPNNYKKDLTITPDFNYQCLIINGLVFIQASEEYLKSLSVIDIEGDLKNEFERPINSQGNKLLILVDVLYEKISDNLGNIYRTNNLPLINIEKSKYFIPILKKINGEHIKNIQDISYLTYPNISSLILRNDKNRDIRVSYKDSY